MTDRLLTVEEAAEILRTTPDAMRKRVWRRQIESVVSGNRRLIRESAIDAYVRANTRKVRR